MGIGHYAFIGALTKTERILLNLMRNAAEAEAQHVTLQVAEGKEGAVVFSVIDDGCGIPKERRDSIFARGATFGKKDGTGLGLSYVKDVARGHGGEVSYSRKEGRSIFQVQIPDALIESVASRFHEESSRLEQEELEIQKIAKEKRTLIVKQPKILMALNDKKLASQIRVAADSDAELELTFEEENICDVALLCSDHNRLLRRGLNAGAHVVTIDSADSIEKILKKLKFRLMLALRQVEQKNNGTIKV